jgi:hypothetical protein
MDNTIEIFVGDVTDMEAHVFARYIGPERVIIRGVLHGPFSDRGRTLPAEFAFRATNPAQPNLAEAVVTDPCMWSSEMPQVYRVDAVAEEGERLIAEYHGTIGLRRLAPRLPVDFAPGTG